MLTEVDRVIGRDHRLPHLRRRAESSYKVDPTSTEDAAKTDQPAGEIKRDGTTVQLPYLTTAPGYAQELLIVNRGTRVADPTAPTPQASCPPPRR